LKGILPAYHGFQGAEKLILFQIRSFRLVENTHVSLKRKPSLLVAGPSRTFILFEKGDGFRQENFLLIIVFNVEEGSFY
jgi:hypothetical protein